MRAHQTKGRSAPTPALTTGQRIQACCPRCLPLGPESSRKPAEPTPAKQAGSTFVLWQPSPAHVPLFLFFCAREKQRPLVHVNGGRSVVAGSSTWHTSNRSSLDAILPRPSPHEATTRGAGARRRRLCPKIATFNLVHLKK